MMTCRVLVCLAAVLATMAGATSAHGQSLNIDFGSSAGGPPASFRAAGLSGNWNSIPGTHTVTYALVGLDGAPIPATVRNIGGLDLVENDHPETSGEIESLLDDYLVTHNPNLETCLFFDNLLDGTYRVVTYAWLPQLPGTDSYVTVDESHEPGVLVGGEWPGTVEEGVVYSVHVAVVVDGTLGMHSGIAPGAAPPHNAALNGVQLVLLPTGNSFVRGDVNADESITLVDALTELEIIFLNAPPAACDATLDANDDGFIALPDPLWILTYLFLDGPAPPDPFPTCDADPTPDALECDAFPGCP